MSWIPAHELLGDGDPFEGAEDAVTLWAMIRPDRYWTPGDDLTDESTVLAAVLVEPIRPKSLLSPAQLRVVDLRRRGLSWRLVAGEMRCSVSTARTHHAAAVAKLVGSGVVIDRLESGETLAS